jgi:hypothetical protein
MAADLLRAAVDPFAQPEPIPELPDQDQTASVRQIPSAVSQAKRSRIALYMGPRSNTMIPHRLGVSREGSFLGRKSL